MVDLSAVAYLVLGVFLALGVETVIRCCFKRQRIIIRCPVSEEEKQKVVECFDKCFSKCIARGGDK